MRQINIYKFSELSDEAKEIAINDMRYDVQDILNVSIADEFQRTAITIEEQYNAHTQKSYTQFIYSGVDSEDYDGADKVKEWVAAHTTKKYDDEWWLTGTYTDDAVCEYIAKVINGEIQVETIEDFLDACGDCINTQWLSAEDYNQSNEVVAEFLDSNNYEFTENGKVFC